jgi:hypothetical protein
MSAPAACSWRSRVRHRVPVQHGLSAGLGSNDIGLDRGGGGGSRVVQFQRVGPRIMLVQGNQSFRSSSKNPLERKSVEDSFAKSIIWGFTVAAESNGRVLVDATDFFMRDSRERRRTPASGNYRLDRTRSAFYLPNTRNFPQNTEVDMTLTFVNEQTGGGGGGGGGPFRVRHRSARPAAVGGGGVAVVGSAAACFQVPSADVTPHPMRVTMREHASFRRAAGRIDVPAAHRRSARRLRAAARSWTTARRLASRCSSATSVVHRLQKKDPNGGDQRADQADSVLGRLGAPGRREEGARRGRQLVEPGV